MATRLGAVFALLWAVLGLGCSGMTQGGGDGVFVALSVTPHEATVAARGTVAFAASVSTTRAADSTAVLWSVKESGGGAVDIFGNYTAPPAAGTYHVVATSVADPAVTDTATVTVSAAPAISVSVVPRSASTTTGGALAFTATVSGTGAGQSTAVSWSVQEAGGGSVDASGHFSAPSVHLDSGPNEVTAVAENALGGRGSDTVQVTRQDDGAPKLRIVLAATRPRFGLNEFGSDVIIAEDVAQFRAELAAAGDSPSLFEPVIDVVAADANFPVHAYVFTDHAGEVSMPAAASFGASDVETLRPIDELADDLLNADLGDPSIPLRLLPWDFAPTHFARFTLQSGGQPQ